MTLKNKIGATLAAFSCLLAVSVFFSAFPVQADHGGSGSGCNQQLDFDCDGSWNNNGRTFVSEEEYFDRNIDIDDFDPSIGSQSSNPCVFGISC